MNISGDAADQVVRYSLEAGEVALKITGEAAKEIAVLLYTILKEEKKTKGKAKLETLIRSGKPLTIFSVKEEDMKKFEKEAKSYGIMYYPIPNSNKDDGVYDIMVKEEDASRINRLVERFKLASVSEAAKVKTEIEKSREEKNKRGKEQKVPEKAQPEKSADDKLVDELLSTPVKKEEKNQSNPSVAKTEKSHLSEPTSRKQNRTAEGTSKKEQNRVRQKPSVRKELQDIKAARKQEAEKTKKGPEQKKNQSRNENSISHRQPQVKKKVKKTKER